MTTQSEPGHENETADSLDMDMSAAPVLLDEMRRQIDEQQSALSVLRSRAVALLSVGSLVAALFGTRIVPGHHSGLTNGAIAVALIAFGCSVISVILVIAPRRGWQFSQNVTPYLGYVMDGKAVSSDYVSFHVARSTEASRAANTPKLKCLHDWFTLTCVFLGIQVVAWGVAIL